QRSRHESRSHLPHLGLRTQARVRQTLLALEGDDLPEQPAALERRLQALRARRGSNARRRMDERPEGPASEAHVDVDEAGDEPRFRSSISIPPTPPPISSTSSPLPPSARTSCHAAPSSPLRR